MKIVNNTNLTYREIGTLIDYVMHETRGTTHYVGQIEHTIVAIGEHKVDIQIRYLKRYVEWRFYEKENNKKSK